MREIDTMKEVVTAVMKEAPRTRDDDSYLIFRVLLRLGLVEDQGAYYIVRKSRLKEMPSFSSITRARRMIQNDEGQLEPSKKSSRGRRRREAEIRDAVKIRKYGGR